MAKKTVGVYLNQYHWHTAARMVRQALDGAGDLQGFISFIESTALEIKQTDLVSSSISKDWMTEWKQMSEKRMPRKSAEDEEWDLAFPPEVNGIWTDLPYSIGEYVDFFENLQTKIDIEPKFIHLLGLYILKVISPDVMAAFTPENKRSVQIPGAVLDLSALLKLFREDPSARSISPFTMVWTRDKLHIYPPGTRLEASQSLYLDPTAHRYFVEVFGTEGLGIIVAQTLYALANRSNRIESIIGFDAELSRILYPNLSYEALIGEDVLSAEDALGVFFYQKYFQKTVPVVSREDWLEVWRLLLSRILYPENLAEVAYENSYSISKIIRDAASSLKNALGSHEPSLALLRGLFELEDEMPTRANLAKILSQLVSTLPQEELMFAGKENHPNPVAFHVARLLQEYAREVMPKAIAGRTELSVLCSLAQFPYTEDPPEMATPREVLEIWSGREVRMLPSGDWLIEGARGKEWVLSKEGVRDWLVELAGAIEGGFSVGDFDVDSFHKLGYFESEKAISLRIGPEFLDFLLNRSPYEEQGDEKISNRLSAPWTEPIKYLIEWNLMTVDRVES